MRFVASTLLDAVRKAETAPASAARAHAYLCKHSFVSCPSTPSIHEIFFSRGLLIDSVRDRAELFVSFFSFVRSLMFFWSARSHHQFIQIGR